MIYPHHLEFMEEAKKAFESNPRFETYRNTEGNLIALRHGLDRNCIGIHEIGKEIGFFAEVMDRAPELVVSSPATREVKNVFKFDVRAEMLARPNEWVGAFKRSDDEWMAIGFDSNHFEVATIPLKHINVAKPTDSAMCQLFESSHYLDECIPIELAPEEERP